MISAEYIGVTLAHPFNEVRLEALRGLQRKLTEDWDVVGNEHLASLLHRRLSEEADSQARPSVFDSPKGTFSACASA